MSGLKNSVLTWWNSNSVREQRLLLICLTLMVFAGVYWGLVQPMADRAGQAQNRINSEKQLHDWVVKKADRITELRGVGGKAISSAPVNQVVSSSVGRYRVELIRMQPRNDSLQVWVKPLPFNQLLNWLAYLEESQGIGVEFIDLAASETEGVVDVKRLQLKRGI
ncbi:type II secretion system protein M [Vibrio sp. JC009]|uniref:type II secretion system protein M n=1 Tax=Vibrio sp. JC009 TaxID=2912314 RepID=UPI0023B1EF66|nr:type II secretion system protein M [Vibrio sp. JC009]WED21934.1 type II secretion system protein M [Vibrio sp. JC009]